MRRVDLAAFEGRTLCICQEPDAYPHPLMT
jgi:hypothetical protein